MRHVREGHLKLGVFEDYGASASCILRWIGLREDVVSKWCVWC